jgi:hypothetical protein
MNFTNPFKTFSPQEIVLLVTFIVYLVFPIQTPSFLTGIIDSPIGLVTIFAITVSLFLYTNPILAILYLFVAYEIIRRTSSKNITVSSSSFKYVDNTPTLNDIDLAQKDVNLHSIMPSEPTLEEEIVNKMSPIGVSDAIVFTNSTYKPFAESVKGASKL